MDWFEQHWLEFASLVLTAAGVWWLMPPALGRPKSLGLLLAVLGAGLLAVQLHVATGPLMETTLFAVFALAAILFSVLMITNRKPVYSALWFALATLSVCGLFLLQYAPFLAAASVIIYAGAIVVTFVFVIMLAQQAGATVYDQHSRQPLAATVSAFVLLVAILSTLGGAQPLQNTDANRTESQTRAEFLANPLSQASNDVPLHSIHGLGRSLFGDYLFAVELAGTLLLVATIGAIAIAPRRRGGML
jgi:NADH-quinone oxidoreductase subunit J